MTNVRSTSEMAGRSKRPLEEYIRDSHVEEEFYLPLLFHDTKQSSGFDSLGLLGIMMQMWYEVG